MPAGIKPPSQGIKILFGLFLIGDTIDGYIEKAVIAKSLKGAKPCCQQH